MWRSHWPVSMPRRSEESSRPWLHESAFSMQVAVWRTNLEVPPIMDPVIHLAEDDFALDEIRVSR
jgi:hypothetical protein